MKMLWIFLLALLTTFGAYSQNNLQPPDYRGAISNVITSFHAAVTNSIVLIKPTKSEILRAQNFHTNALPHRAISFKKLADSMCMIDTSECPDDFKTAWKTFATSLTLSETLSPAERRQLLGDVVKTVVLPVPGVGIASATADLMKDSGKKAEVEGVRRSAVFQLKLCAASYGVTNWSR